MLPEKRRPYHIGWVSQFYAFSKKDPGEDDSSEDVERFSKDLNKSPEGWQMKQAKGAIALYGFYRRRASRVKRKGDISSDRE